MPPYGRHSNQLLVRITGVSGKAGVLKLDSLKLATPGPVSEREFALMKKQTQQTRTNGTGWLACLVLLVVSVCTPAAQAQTRLIVTDSLGLPGINLTCLLTGCTVVRGLGDPNGQLFLVTLPPILNPVTKLLQISLQLGVLGVEVDQVVSQQQPNSTGTPSYMTDETPVSYYGTTVWQGYLVQPGNQLVRTAQTQAAFNAAGAGVIVADIDTGVDPTHPVLQGVLVDGYDFTRNTSGGSEDADVSGGPTSNQDNAQASPALLDQRTVAVLDQRTVAVLDGGSYSDFGHGTMTAGIIHLVAPQAKIMPLKAFSANGSAYSSDILRAIYYAVANGAQVMNMSWNYSSYSADLAQAIKYANSKGVISVASAGNSGEYTVVYPGGLPGVIDVASTSNEDTQSSFTNYGAPPVFMAAPGEGVVTTYPWGTYAAGWGTSFSTPFVAGTAAVMMGANSHCPNRSVPLGLADAHYIGNINLGFGRLDTFQAMQACKLVP
jgi:subtilisin family serine protease